MSFQLSLKAKAILSRSQEIDWFVNAGKPLSESRSPHFPDWKVATKCLLSIRTLNFFNDGRNDISEHAFLNDQRRFNQWNAIGECADIVIESQEWKMRVENSLPLKQPQRFYVVDKVAFMVGLAVVEEQLSDLHSCKLFRTMFEWLERGHLVCGSESRYPRKDLLIY
jgi:hypothetical protein